MGHINNSIVCLILVPTPGERKMLSTYNGKKVHQLSSTFLKLRISTVNISLDPCDVIDRTKLNTSKKSAYFQQVIFHIKTVEFP